MANNNMSFIFGASSTQSSGNSLYSSLGDYSSIRSGNYKRLLKSYYEEKKNSSSTDSTSSMNTDSVEKKALLEAKNSGDTLAEAANKLLHSDSLFEKKEITTTDPKTGEKTTKMDYDRDAIYKAVKSFVDSYNGAVESAGDVDNKSVLRNTLFMTNQTAAYKKSFAKVGITIGTDNKLSVSEDTLKKADINELKTLFTGFNSFASKTAEKASAISRISALASGTKIYTKTGAHDKSTLYNKLNTSI